MEFAWRIIIPLGIVYLVRTYNKNKHKKVNDEKENQPIDVDPFLPLKQPPEIIKPIEPSPLAFNLSSYSNIEFNMPLNEGCSQKDLNGYAERIDACRSVAEYNMTKAVEVFEKDYELLKNQKLQIYRRIYLSKNILTRFTELQGNVISSTDIPDIYRIKIPPKPKFATLHELQREYAASTSQVYGAGARAAGRALTSNGGIRNSDNLLLALGSIVIAGVAGEIKERANISKFKRALVDIKGNVSNYSISLKTTVSILSNSHDELVVLSNKLKNSEIAIIDTVDRVGAVPNEIIKLDQLQTEMRQYIKTLYFLLLEAESYVKNPL